METKAAKEAVPAILFLHGYGGSLLWNLWALKTSFPDHVILMPSGGIAWPDQDAAVVHQYVRGLIENVEAKHGITIDRPWLFSLSQCGPTGFWLASEYPSDFKGYAAIATWAQEPGSLPVDREFPILMVNGDKDLPAEVQPVKDDLAARLLALALLGCCAAAVYWLAGLDSP